MDMIEQLIEKNANKISYGGQVMFMTCVNSFTFGCNWGFLKSSTQTFKDTFEALKEERKNIHFYRVKNGVMIECNEEYLCSILNTLFDGKCPINYQQLASRRKEEPEKFAQWLKRVRKDYAKLPYIKRNQHGYAIQCAVCSVNDSNAIKVAGVNNPAFKLNLQEMLSMFARTPDFSNIWVSADGNNGVTYLPISAVFNDLNNTKAVYRAATISESNTGLFINLLLRM